MSAIPFRLEDLDQRHPGLTPAIARMFFEAASVCLDRHHTSPAEFSIERETNTAIAKVGWLPVGPSLKAAYANTIDTTEAGAYGMCLAAVEHVAGLVAIQRAETLTGADYYVAPIGSAVDDLEDALRFEVSGVDKGKRSLCDQRLRAKVKQTQAASHGSTAIAAVTGFEQQIVLLSAAVEP